MGNSGAGPMGDKGHNNKIDSGAGGSQSYFDLRAWLGILACWAGLLYIVGIVKTPTISHLFESESILSGVPDRTVPFGVMLVVIGILLIIASGAWERLPWCVVDAVVARREPSDSGQRGACRHYWGVFTCAMVVYALVLVRVSTPSYTHALVVPFVGALVAFGWVLRRRGPPVAGSFSVRRIDIIIVIVAPLLLTARYWSDIPSWYFSFWGDERAFFSMAKALLLDPGPPIFQYEGVYGKFPIADSYILSLFLWLFGSSIVGWKLASIVIFGLSCGAVYWCGAVLFNRWVGVFAFFFLAANHYLGAFALIGYNNVHMCLTSTVAITLFAAAYRNRSRALAYAAGVVCGLMSYSIWGGLLIVPIVGLLALGLGAIRGGKSEALGLLLPITFGSFLAAFPGLISNPAGSISRVAMGLSHGKGFAGTHTLVNTPWDSWASLSTSIVALFRNDWWGSHYVYAPLLDPITGFLLVLGFAVVASGGRSWGATILFSWLLGGFLGVVLLSRLNTPYLSRLILMMPPLSIASGIGVVWLLQLVRQGWARGILLSIVGASVVVSNIQLLYVVSPLRTMVSTVRLAIREIQYGDSESFVVVVRGSVVDPSMRDLLIDYTPPSRRVIFVTETELRLLFGSRDLLSRIPLRSTVLAHPDLRDALQQLSHERFGGRPVLSIAPQVFGEGLISINGRVTGSISAEIRPMPRWLRSLIGVS